VLSLFLSPLSLLFTMEQPLTTRDLDAVDNFVRQARAYHRAQAQERFAHIRREKGLAMVARARLCCQELEAEEVWIPRIVSNTQGN
jgi:hypothetical protein